MRRPTRPGSAGNEATPSPATAPKRLPGDGAAARPATATAPPAEHAASAGSEAIAEGAGQRLPVIVMHESPVLHRVLMEAMIAATLAPYLAGTDGEEASGRAPRGDDGSQP